MFRRAKLGFVPSRFLDLKGDVPLCASCMFATSSRIQWKTKCNKLGSIRKQTDNNTEYVVSVDQLQSNQTRLVPQSSGKITSACIWDAKVIVDHFSDITYLHLTIIIIQEKTLAVKSDFERMAATFGVNINRYHKYNVRFSEQPLRSEIEDYNRTITFCGVLSNHQNAIVEIKFQNLTLVDRTLLLHAKRYWPEVITKML